MNARSKLNRNRIVFLVANLGLAGLAVVVGATGLRAQTSGGPDVFKIEEDWQLIVNDPSVNDNGPQVSCTISPLDMDTAYCAFDINYHTQPDYSAGGLQIHTWDPVDPIEYSNSSHNGLMSTAGETVTWTMRMKLVDNHLDFKVKNGQSQTWGSFGWQSSDNAGHLDLSLPTTLSNLNGYSSDVTLNNSGACYAGNEVISLTLVAVRWYDANGNLIKQNTTPQVVHPQQ